MDSDLQKQSRDSFDAQLDLSHTVARLTQPLYKHFGLTLYCYILIYESGEICCLTNHRALDEQIYSDNLHTDQRHSIIDQLQMFPQLGNYLLDADPMLSTKRNSTAVKIFHKFDFHHDFMTIKQIHTPKGKALQMSHYAAPEQQLDANRLYINKIELLHRFNRHVEQTLDETLRSVPLIPPTSRERATAEQQFSRLLASAPYPNPPFVKDTGMHYPKYKELADLTLSGRERDLIRWYLLGKTETDTAAILNLSVNTVRNYFKRLKSKFNCYSKTQLILKLTDAGLIEESDWQAIY